MSLQACVDREASGSRVHRGHVLDIFDVFECEFLAVVPVLVVQVLEEEEEEEEEELARRKRSETKKE